MNLLERHLPDERLIAARDGERLEAPWQAHLDACPFCRERLAAWQAFSRRMESAVPPEAPERGPLTESRDSLFYRQVSPALSSESAVPEKKPATEPLTDDWTAPLLKAFSGRPPATDLGRIEVGRDREGNPTLRQTETPDVDVAVREAALAYDMAYGVTDELALHFGELTLALAVRRAGLRIFLVVQVSEGPDRAPVTDGEATLIPEREAIRRQPLDHGRDDLAGMAWFVLPYGHAELFLHRGRTARLRIDHLPASR
ncbi:hypothetical protein QVG61_07215 [Thiohalobacter sp. IOR34]|uniref:hypothetical protein n=1 Tax=Thiohalobacter sp. IOR34 TaxID=3057176 RepID=UPI0025B213E4|nr:hypothetical protein [Thiohalobacter sp. IOR34]WJW74312.1 hypothetical protein QVG61_07215 [Thiohalobacter sp. IOR34]